MTVDRMPEGVPPASALPSGADAAAADAAARRAIRVQMLATEHWSLLATRSLSWNEAFSRASMFLSLLSGAVVALALVAQASSFGEGFVLFAVLVLPVVLFVGVATYVRLLEINNEDYVWVRGMNRLRGAYLEIDPGLAPYFITGVTEDAVGIFRTFGASDEDLQRSDWFHGFVTTPATIGFVNAMLAAVLAGIVVSQLRMTPVPAAGVGVAAFLVACVLLGYAGYRSQAMARLSGDLRHRVSDDDRTD
ncbi:MAG TPA: hypothetical protein VIA82_06745 [Candidatus Limnocylindria bacterium]|jgi:hypothetical protein